MGNDIVGTKLEPEKKTQLAPTKGLQPQNRIGGIYAKKSIKARKLGGEGTKNTGEKRRLKAEG